MCVVILVSLFLFRDSSLPLLDKTIKLAVHLSIKTDAYQQSKPVVPSFTVPLGYLDILKKTSDLARNKLKVVIWIVLKFQTSIIIFSQNTSHILNPSLLACRMRSAQLPPFDEAE